MSRWAIRSIVVRVIGKPGTPRGALLASGRPHLRAGTADGSRDDGDERRATALRPGHHARRGPAGDRGVELRAVAAHHPVLRRRRGAAASGRSHRGRLRHVRRVLRAGARFAQRLLPLRGPGHLRHRPRHRQFPAVLLQAQPAIGRERAEHRRRCRGDRRRRLPHPAARPDPRGRVRRRRGAAGRDASPTRLRRGQDRPRPRDRGARGVRDVRSHVRHHGGARPEEPLPAAGDRPAGQRAGPSLLAQVSNRAGWRFHLACAATIVAVSALCLLAARRRDPAAPPRPALGGRVVGILAFSASWFVKGLDDMFFRREPWSQRSCPTSGWASRGATPSRSCPAATTAPAVAEGARELRYTV